MQKILYDNFIFQLLYNDFYAQKKIKNTIRHKLKSAFTKITIITTRRTNGSFAKYRVYINIHNKNNLLDIYYFYILAIKM